MTALAIHLVETWKRDPEFPCADYVRGAVKSWATCETDGHYLCSGCQENTHRLKDAGKEAVPTTWLCTAERPGLACVPDKHHPDCPRVRKEAGG